MGERVGQTDVRGVGPEICNLDARGMRGAIAPGLEGLQAGHAELGRGDADAVVATGWW